MADPTCPLCTGPGGEVLTQDGFSRVVLAAEPGHPVVCRVILQEHRREMTDLTEPEAARLMARVRTTERALRDLLAPDKINLASLGNLVPHLHWHVIPRWRDDPHFPRPIWAAPERGDRQPPALAELAGRLRTALNR